MTKVGPDYGMALPLQMFAMAEAEVAMDVPNKRYYTEKTVNSTAKIRVHIQVLQTHTSKTAKNGTVNLVAEHFGVVTMCFTTKFTILIFAVFDV